MVDISIVNGIINQLITWGAPPCISTVDSQEKKTQHGSILATSTAALILHIRHSAFPGFVEVAEVAWGPKGKNDRAIVDGDHHQ